MAVNLSHIPLITTKLYRPSVASVHVHRPRLLDDLNDQLLRSLTLVCAPAGYGKSHLVSSWLEGCDLPSAWLSIDETDNDLRVFLAYFLAAIQSISPGVGKEIQAILKAPELPPLPVLAIDLINELDTIDRDL
jgi:LuxR family maltose regulon positive regulatory protein